VTNYSNNPGMVEVQFFKTSGKWYMSEAVDMSKHYEDLNIFDAVRESIREGHERGQSWMDQFVTVVQNPYHKNAYPVMLQPQWMYEVVQETAEQNYRDEARKRILERKGWLVNGEPEPGYDYIDFVSDSGMFFNVERTPEGIPFQDDALSGEGA
jgi:hypothetical protein